MRTLTLAALVLGALLTGTTPATAVVRPSAQQQAQPAYCAYTAHNLSAFVDLERRLGTSLDCAVIFSDAVTTWQDWENPWFLRVRSTETDLNWRDWSQAQPGRSLVLTHSLLPQNPPADWRRRGAAGEYDAHAVVLARNLVQAGLGGSTIRLAHEANGTWFHHSVGDTVEERRQWAQFWARTVRAMRSVEGASFRFDLTVNAAYRPIPLDEYYPGNDVVDMIGIDQYDACTGACATTTGAERWRLIENQRGGIGEIAAYARAHGKPISIPETGLVDKNHLGAGDNPSFVRGLRTFVAANDVAYVAYFDKNVGGTLRLAEVPKSFQAWRSMVRTGGSVLTASRAPRAGAAPAAASRTSGRTTTPRREPGRSTPR